LFRAEAETQTPPLLKSDDPLAERFRDLFAGYTHSPDGRTAAIVCMLRPHGPEKSLNVPRETTIAKLEEIVGNLPGDLTPGVLAGEPVMIFQGFALRRSPGYMMMCHGLNQQRRPIRSGIPVSPIRCQNCIPILKTTERLSPITANGTVTGKRYQPLL
jgi:hypothetical protein